MTTRNIKQFAASVAKLGKDDIKHNDVATITENGKAVVVSAEHDEVVKLASELRQIASKLLTDEREYANDEVIRRMTKDKDLLAQYAMRLQQSNDESTSNERHNETNFHG